MWRQTSFKLPQVLRSGPGQNGDSPHAGTLRRAGAGGLAPIPQKPAWKAPASFTLLGTRVAGVDTDQIVHGRPLYGIDVRLPGMRYAAIAVSNGQVAEVDDAAALAVPGVRQVVRIAGHDNPTFLMPGVAVVADTTWAAFKGRDALRVQWREGAFAGETSATISAQCAELARGAGTTVRAVGDVDAALASASRVVEAYYESPFLAHATLEPHNCTADVRDGHCYITGPLQMQTSGARVVAAAIDLPVERVHVQATRLGGGFGRRLLSDYAAEAAVVSKAIGAPVQVVGTREDDLRHDYYRPAGARRLRVGVDGAGRIIAWDCHLVNISRNAGGIGQRPPEGRVRGVAAHYTIGSYCAQVVELSVAAASEPATGGMAPRRVTVHKVTCALDCGIVVNRSGVEAQAQGGIIDGLGTAFFGAISIDRGRAVEGNVDRYRLIRHREAPRAIDVHIVPSTMRPTGFGEIAVPVIAPAIANAIT